MRVVVVLHSPGQALDFEIPPAYLPPSGLLYVVKQAHPAGCLFQLIFQTCIAEEQGEFTFDDVIKGIVLKMRRRHPHVFEGVRYASPEAQKQAWQTIKMLERFGLQQFKAGF